MSMHSGSARGFGRPRRPLRVRNPPKLGDAPGGIFEMGSPAEEAGRFPREGPLHFETIQALAVGVFPVTKGEYRKFVNATKHPTATGAWAHNAERKYREIPGLTWEEPGFEQDDDHPVVCVSWHDATAYAAWLAEQSGKRYRLLTEAEWEYVARAGTATPYHFGHVITGNANYMDSKEEGTCPGASYEANFFGLYSVHGNVWEWVADRWRDSHEHRAPEEGDKREKEGWGNCSCVQDFTDYVHGAEPAPDVSQTSYVQPKTCPCHVIRGGSWTNRARHCRSASRLGWHADYRAYNIGFRVGCSSRN